jgi:hypothetical protein
MQPDHVSEHVTAICSAAWWVRWWARPHQQDKRAEALRALGLAARAAFNATDDFGPLLYAIRDTLTERN